MYKPIEDTKNWEPLSGLGPWRGLSDEEFERLDAELGGGLSRWFEHTDDKQPARNKKEVI